MNEGWIGLDFVDDEQVDLVNCYYEVFIVEENQVLICINWYDIFNVMMWIVFLCSKKLINVLYCEEIVQFGVYFRIFKCNCIMYFDECGLVIVVL